MGRDGDGGIELAQGGLDQRQAADRPGLAGRNDRARGGTGRHGCGRGDIAGAAEIFRQRAGDRLVDDQRRQECVGVEGSGHGDCLSDRAAGRNLNSVIAARASANPK